MALSSHERKVLDEIELDLKKESPELDGLLSSMCNVGESSDGLDGGQLARVWRHALGSSAEVCVRALRRIPRAVYICAALGVIALLITLSSSVGSLDTTQPNACTQPGGGGTTQTYASGAAVQEGSDRVPVESVGSLAASDAVHVCQR